MSEEKLEEKVIEVEKEPVITVRKLLEAGVHFGHQTKRWNPKMAKYIYTAREGIYIMDLQKTAAKIEEAYAALKEIVVQGGRVLFVGAKRSAQEIVEEEALRSGSFYVTQRWLGGTMTNFRTIQKRLKRLNDLEKQAIDGTYDLLPKKEVALLEKERTKLKRVLDGIKEMRKLPNAIFVVDPKIEHNAVKEARKLKIPVFGIVDTNNDPDDVDYIIPGNDDAAKSVKLIVAVMADAVVEARGGETVIAYTKDEVEGEVLLSEELKKMDDQKVFMKKEDREPRDEFKKDHKKEYKPSNRDSRKDSKPAEVKSEEKPVAKKAATNKEEAEEKPVAKKAATKKEEVAEEKPATKKVATKKEEVAEEKPATKKVATKKEEVAEEKPVAKKVAAKKAETTEETKKTKKGE